jgi:mono/diheme cytochrome c family protein
MRWRAAGVLLLTWGFMLQTAQPQSLLQRVSAFAEQRPNPYVGDENARRAGQKLFRRECSGCHGEAGKGNGRQHTPPLATQLVRRADPGTLFWILRNGSESHRMPSFSHLPEPQRWQIITYLKTLR